MESQYCPQCGTANAVGFRFCQSCGAPLSQVPAPTVVSTAAPSLSAAEPRPPVSAPTAAVPVQPKPLYAPARPAAEPTVGQMGTGGISALDIWGPFAGYGQRGRHVSWLLNNLGERAEALRDTVYDRFHRRQIPKARIEQKVLTGRGILVERRPFHLLRRGIATAGVYVAQFGQDLYISLVTYSKGAINPLRVLILSLMILFQLYLVIGYASSVAGSAQSALGSFDLFSGYSGDGGGALGVLLCCIGPLGALNTLGLSLAGLHMVYKFFVERDPLALLRTPPNEFQLDDIVALEKAVEETVRQSLDVVGIDSALMPPAAEYGIKQRLI